MNYELLNKMINYIEDNLDNTIDLNKLSKITNTNLFILERIYMFLTNMTIIEYIKKRRLSKAFEEIRNTEKKIIDIAFKYQYNSQTSFNRAFKQLFQITPTECRKGIGNYKLIPIQYFEQTKNKNCFDYELKKIQNKILYCHHIKANTHSDLLFKIKQLYKTVKVNKQYEKFNKIGLYGIFFKDNIGYHYLLGSEIKLNQLEKFIIQSGTYAVFSLPSRKQKSIVELEQRINKQWIPSTDFKVESPQKIEYYQDNICYIYLKVEHF